MEPNPRDHRNAQHHLTRDNETEKQSNSGAHGGDVRRTTAKIQSLRDLQGPSVSAVTNTFLGSLGNKPLTLPLISSDLAQFQKRQEILRHRRILWFNTEKGDFKLISHPYQKLFGAMLGNIPFEQYTCCVAKCKAIGCLHPGLYHGNRARLSLLHAG